MYEINWSVEGVMRCKEREKEKRRTRSRKKSPVERKQSPEEKAAADRKRLEEIQAFRDHVDSIKRKAREAK